MDLLRTLYVIKEFLLAGIQKFPLIIGTTSLGLACATANVGYVLLFLSIALIVPLGVLLSNSIIAPLITTILDFLIKLLPGDFGQIDWTPKNTAGICRAAGSVPGGAFPTYYMAVLFFVFGFTFWNGLSIYRYDSNQDENDEKVKARKAHAIIGMISSLALLLIFFFVRVMSGCEHWFGIILGMAFFGLAIGIFEFFRFCNLLRLVDLYGIGSRLLSLSATDDATKVCFPVGDGPALAKTDDKKNTNTQLANAIRSFSGKI
jgi:hypothetical protein